MLKTIQLQLCQVFVHILFVEVQQKALSSDFYMCCGSNSTKCIIEFYTQLT